VVCTYGTLGNIVEYTTLLYYHNIMYVWLLRMVVTYMLGVGFFARSDFLLVDPRIPT